MLHCKPLFRFAILVVLLPVVACPLPAWAQATKPTGTEASEQKPDLPAIRSVYGLSDFVDLNNGKTLALIRNDGLHTVSYQSNGFRWSRYSDSFFDGRPTTFERIFADGESEDGYLLFTRYRTDGKEPRFVFYNRGGKQQWGLITKAFDDASYHQAKNGAVFVYSRDGLIVRIHRGRIENYEMPIAKELAKLKGKLQPIKCVESDEGVVIFYAMVDPSLKKKTLASLIVFDDRQPVEKRWQKISLAGRQTGPGWFRSRREFCLVNARQLLTVNLNTQKVSVASHDGFQSDEKVALKPVDVLVDPQGQPHVVWRHFYRSAFRYDVAPQKDGKFHRLATPSFDKNGSLTWKDESVTLDYGLYRSRMHAVDAKGNWWIASSGALLCRTVDGQWKEFGFRYGYPEDFSGNLIQFDKQNRLWLSNTNKSGARPLMIDVDRLAAIEVTLSDRWQKIQQTVPLWRFNAEGNLACLDRSDRLHMWTDDGKQILQLPATSAENEEGELESQSFNFRNDRLKYEDSRWQWSQAKTKTKHVYSDGKWTDEATVEKDLRKRNFPSQGLSSSGSRENCPIADRTRMNRYADPISRVRSSDRVAVASPNGRWHTYVWSNEVERELLFRRVYADNRGRLFVPRDGYYQPSASVIWYEPMEASLQFATTDLGKVTEANQSLKIGWQLKQAADQKLLPTENGVYRWQVDGGRWSRWLSIGTDPIIYALPEMGEHQMQVEVNFPGAFLADIRATLKFETTYDLKKQLDASFRGLDSELFEERQQALNKIAKFGFGILPQLEEIKKSGSTEARMNAIKLIQRIETETPKDAQHSKK